MERVYRSSRAWPLVSVRNDEFLANEVPGVVVPQDVIDRMRRANEKSKEYAIQEGIAIAREMFERVRLAVQGVQVSAPLDLACRHSEVVRVTRSFARFMSVDYQTGRPYLTR